MKLLFSVIFIALESSAVVSYKISIEPNDAQIKRGDIGIMECQFTESAPSCYWTKDGRLTDMSGRYQFDGDPVETGDCSIAISNSSLELDDGLWQCGVPSASNRSGVISRAAIFNVLVPPKQPVLYKDGELVANESVVVVDDPWDPPNILCESEGGNPASQLEFRVGNNLVPGLYQVVPDVLSSNKTQTATVQLLVNSSQGLPLFWDKQILACVARHPFDDNAYHTFYVHLEVKAASTSVHLTAGPADFQAKRGQKGLLRCDFSGPTSDCYWTKDNELIAIGNRYKYLGNPNTSGDCSLVITDSQPEMDSGIWRCGKRETSRHKGIMSAPARYLVLIEPRKPVISYNGRKMANREQVIVERHQMSPNISCESAMGQPEATLKWQLDNITVNGTTSIYNGTDGHTLSTRTAILNLTKPLNESWLGKILWCIAGHPAYETEQSASLQLLQHTSIANVTGSIHLTHVDQQNPHPPTEHSDHSGRLSVNASSVIHLRCKADGHPQPHHFMWERRDEPNGQWETFDHGQNISFTARAGQYSCIAWNTQHGEFKARSATYEIVVINDDGSDSLSNITSTTIAVIGIILIIAVVSGLYIRCHRRRRRARAMERENEQDRNLANTNVYEKDPMKREDVGEQTYEEICYLEPRSADTLNHHSSADHVYQEIKDE